MQPRWAERKGSQWADSREVEALWHLGVGSCLVKVNRLCCLFGRAGQVASSARSSVEKCWAVAGLARGLGITFMSQVYCPEIYLWGRM